MGFWGFGVLGFWGLGGRTFWCIGGLVIWGLTAALGVLILMTNAREAVLALGCAAGVALWRSKSKPQRHFARVGFVAIVAILALDLTLPGRMSTLLARLQDWQIAANSIEWLGF